MRQPFFLTLSLFILIWAFGVLDCVGSKEKKKSLMTDLTFDEMYFFADHPTIREQVMDIDRQLIELQDMKRGFEARALRHEDQAQRLQFEDRAVLETRRHLDLADENRAKAAKVQEEIDRLQIERRKLLQRT